MNTRHAAALHTQSLIIYACKEGGITNAELALAMGCDRSEVSRFDSGERAMDVPELAGLVRRFGAVAALSALAAIGGATVTSSTVEATPLKPAAIGMVGDAASLLASVHAKLADGVLTGTEGAELESELTALIRRAEGMRAALRGHV